MPGLLDLKPSKRAFRPAMSYWSYRPDNRRQTPDRTVSKETGNKVRRIQYTLDSVFAGNGHIRVLEFLNCMPDAAYHNGLHEG